MRSLIRCAALILIGVLLGGCGEKIEIPTAQGVPTSSSYLEIGQWDLDDPTDLIVAAGKIFVTEGAPGTVTKFNSRGQVDKGPVEGLAFPRAVCLDSLSRTIVVGESGGDGVPPRLSFFSQADLEPRGSFDLAGLARSVSAVISLDEWLYVSDPDSGAVLRFLWLDKEAGLLEPRGEVCNDRGSRESPQFVRVPGALALDRDGMLLVCDADTLRSWVVRFDPVPPPDGPPDALGSIEPFRPVNCATFDASAYVLGRAPGCGETDFEYGPGEDAGELSVPWGVALDRDGRIYVADTGNGRGQRFQSDGAFQLEFGSGAGGAPALVQPIRLATVHGSTSRNNIQIEIPGAQIYVIDAATAQVRAFEDKRWTEFQGGS
jgi:hypothetical protein